MNVDNMFDYMDNAIVCDDFYYHIGNMCGNTLLTIATRNNKIITYSNEWLYLIKIYYETKKKHVCI